MHPRVSLLDHAPVECVQEGDSDDEDLVFGVGGDPGNVGNELGMAAESVLRSIPRHRLRALEKEQMDALESNKATRARRPHSAL